MTKPFLLVTDSSLNDKTEQDYLQVLKSHDINTMVCYGLGNLNNPVSIKQWEFCMGLQSFLQVPSDAVFVYDPIFNSHDKEYLEATGVSILDGPYTPTTAGTILYYLPHCEHFVNDAVLSCHWERLQSIVLIGNSLTHYSENVLVQAKFKERSRHLYSLVQQSSGSQLSAKDFSYTEFTTVTRQKKKANRLKKYGLLPPSSPSNDIIVCHHTYHEIPLPSYTPLPNAFNNMSLMTFTTK